MHARRESLSDIYRKWSLNRSPRALEVARSFRLDPKRPDPYHESRAASDLLEEIRPRCGQITLIVGASGAGKSSLLRQLRDSSNTPWIDVDETTFPNRPIVDCFAETTLDEALPILSQVGLADVWTYLRTPVELSDGQRWRLRLAMALHRARRIDNAVLVSDEFVAILDRVTASVIARMLRKSIEQSRSAVVATSHDDLIDSLKPDKIVRCDFGRIQILKGGDAARSINAKSSARE